MNKVLKEEKKLALKLERRTIEEEINEQSIEKNERIKKL